MISRTQRHRFDDSSDEAESLYILIPSSEKTWLSNPYFLGKSFDDNFFELLRDRFCHFNFPFSELSDGSDIYHVKTSVSSAIKFIIDLEDPSVDVQIVGD